MQCVRCKEETHSLSYRHGQTVKDGVCPTCALIIGMPDNDGFPAMVAQSLQLVDAGLADLPAIINELHGRMCSLVEDEFPAIPLASGCQVIKKPVDILVRRPCPNGISIAEALLDWFRHVFLPSIQVDVAAETITHTA